MRTTILVEPFPAGHRSQAVVKSNDQNLWMGLGGVT